MATTVCATVGVHTLTHIFRTQFPLRDVQTSRTRMAQGVCSAHVISLHLALSILMFLPPSLLFPDGHFETTFPTLTSMTSLPNVSRPKKARVVRTSARAPRSLATWPIPRTPQVMSPRSSTRPLL